MTNQIIPSPGSSSNRLSRRHEEMVVTRLRVGHTKQTHSYLLSKLFPLDFLKCGADHPTNEPLFTGPQLIPNPLSPQYTK